MDRYRSPHRSTQSLALHQIVDRGFWYATACLVLLHSAAAPKVAAAGEAPLRMASEVGSYAAVIEVRGMARDQAELAIRAAFVAAREVGVQIAQQTASSGASSGEQQVEAGPFAQLLRRSLEFCLWSQGAIGPLGGRVHAQWETDESDSARYRPGDTLDEARASALCDRAWASEGSSPPNGAVTIAAGSTLDLRTFVPGVLVDRAVEELQAQGVTNGLVEIGRVVRAFGDGPVGRGWPVSVPPFEKTEGSEGKREHILLRNEAMAVFWAADYEPTEIPVLDLRTGRPPDSGTWAVAVVAELGVDANALAIAGYILGAREGEFRAGNLRPRPSMLWLLGSGTGQPLTTRMNWSQLTLR